VLCQVRISIGNNDKFRATEASLKDTCTNPNFHIPHKVS
jgi:hypothetical protein